MRISDDLFWITPSGPHKGGLSPSDMVLMSTSGEVVEASLRRPSSEWRMHAAIYKVRSDAKAVVHAHGSLSTTLATLIGGITPLSEEGVIYLGGRVQVVPWRRAGTWDLANAVAEALEDSNIVVIERHGSVAVGPNLEVACARVESLEEAAEHLRAVLRSGRGGWRSVLWP